MIGTTLAQYRVTAVLGAGGMGEVWRAEDTRLGRGVAVKVLDFGLAKAWETESGDSSLSMSPTLTRHATVEGVILGTAACISPEQARDREVDRRADIWFTELERLVGPGGAR